MATTIKIKNSATPSSTPSSLEQGEMALNVTDGRLFYGSGSGNTVKEFTGATIDTGSFATTGSNTFIGNQIISGNLDITGSATLTGITYPTTDGDNGDIIFTNGAGVLSFGKTTVYASVKNVTGGTLPKGMPVHASSSVGNVNEVIVASASNAATMPATFILAQQLDHEEEGLGIVTGFINGVDTSGFQEGQVVYVGENGGYTNVKPSGSNLIQNLGIVTKVAVNGSGFIYGSGRANDTPNLLENHIFFGSSSNQQYQLHISGALDQTLINNITASGNISASGAVIASTLTGSLNIPNDGTLGIGPQTFYPHGDNGFSVNEDYDVSNSSTQTAYHFTSGDNARDSVVFSLARTSAFTNMFGITGSSANNKFVIGAETSNTDFEFRTGLGVQPVQLQGGTLLGSLSRSGSLFISNDITASGNISTSGQIYGQAGNTEFATSTVGSSRDYSGDTIKLFSTSVNTGEVYYLLKNNWFRADNTAVSTSDNLLGIAIGSNSNQGMLLRGLYNLGYDPGGLAGDPVYLDASGLITSTLPTTSGEIVRIVGYNIDTNIIYFNPSNDYIVLA